MSVLSAQSILARIEWTKINRDMYQESCSQHNLGIKPFFGTKQLAFGTSYGLTSAGYDVRVGMLSADPYCRSRRLEPGDFLLCASMERIKVPYDLQVIVHDKSSWARKGLALQNTVLEPGWEGFITLELSNHGREVLVIHQGQPIAQLVFHKLDEPTTMPYKGKYQNQGAAPQPTILEEANSVLDYQRKTGDYGT